MRKREGVSILKKQFKFTQERSTIEDIHFVKTISLDQYEDRKRDLHI